MSSQRRTAILGIKLVTGMSRVWLDDWVVNWMDGCTTYSGTWNGLILSSGSVLWCKMQ